MDTIDKNQLGYIGPNPKYIEDFFYLGTVSPPHGNTVRTDYTVPTGRQALVLSGDMEMMRLTAASTVLQSFINLQITVPVVDGGSGVAFNTWQIGSSLLNINDKRQRSGSLMWPLYEDWLIEFETLDVSTGGSIDFTCSASIIEFDKP